MKFEFFYKIVVLIIVYESMYQNASRKRKVQIMVDRGFEH